MAVPPRELARLADTLRTEGRSVRLNESDGQDPLGGVVSIEARGCLPVQIVNFDNSPAGGFPALVRDSLVRASAERLSLPLGGAGEHKLVVTSQGQDVWIYARDDSSCSLYRLKSPHAPRSE